MKEKSDIEFQKFNLKFEIEFRIFVITQNFTFYNVSTHVLLLNFKNAFYILIKIRRYNCDKKK